MWWSNNTFQDTYRTGLLIFSKSRTEGDTYCFAQWVLGGNTSSLASCQGPQHTEEERTENLCECSHSQTWYRRDLYGEWQVDRHLPMVPLKPHKGYIFHKSQNMKNIFLKKEKECFNGIPLWVPSMYRWSEPSYLCPQACQILEHNGPCSSKVGGKWVFFTGLSPEVLPRMRDLLRRNRTLFISCTIHITSKQPKNKHSPPSLQNQCFILAQEKKLGAWLSRKSYAKPRMSLLTSGHTHFQSHEPHPHKPIPATQSWSHTHSHQEEKILSEFPKV